MSETSSTKVGGKTWGRETYDGDEIEEIEPVEPFDDFEEDIATEGLERDGHSVVGRGTHGSDMVGQIIWRDG